ALAADRHSRSRLLVHGAPVFAREQREVVRHLVRLRPHVLGREDGDIAAALVVGGLVAAAACKESDRQRGEGEDDVTFHGTNLTFGGIGDRYGLGTIRLKGSHFTAGSPLVDSSSGRKGRCGSF